MHRADNIHVPIVWKPGSLNLMETSGHVKACTWIAFTYFLSDKKSNYVPSDERFFSADNL